jgi:hypothetical protein
MNNFFVTLKKPNSAEIPEEDFTVITMSDPAA